MGITLGSKRYSCDLGLGGFMRFRNLVAEKVGDVFYNHYISMDQTSVSILVGQERAAYFKEYDAKTMELIIKGVVAVEIANFLYQSDVEGKVNRIQAKLIYDLIKDSPDETIFGYSMLQNCARMRDMKLIFSDKTAVSWS